jgi:hypothetical protein
MWRSMLAIVGLLTVAATAQADTHFFEAAGTLKPDGQVFYPLALKQGVFTYITVTGSGKSDIDCYLLVKPEANKAWHVLGLDEADKDACYLGGYIKTDKPLKLWIRNNGTAVDQYSVVVDQ